LTICSFRQHLQGQGLAKNPQAVLNDADRHIVQKKQARFNSGVHIGRAARQVDCHLSLNMPKLIVFITGSFVLQHPQSCPRTIFRLGPKGQNHPAPTPEKY